MLSKILRMLWAPTRHNRRPIATSQISRVDIDDFYVESDFPKSISIDAVLLAWLIVALRMQRDEDAAVAWACRPVGQETDKDLRWTELSVNSIIKDPQMRVRDALGVIYERKVEIDPAVMTGPVDVSADVSLLLRIVSSLKEHDKNFPQENPVIMLSRTNTGFSLSSTQPIQKDVSSYTLKNQMNGLSDVIKACIHNPDATVESCDIVTNHDLDLIWSWNDTVPPTYNTCVHDVISSRAQKIPQKQAIFSWDGTLTYEQVESYSSQAAHLLLAAGVQTGDFVSICFEKSRWTIVAVLAAMKAGGTIVLMDPTLPFARLQNMATQTNSAVIFSSREQMQLSTSIIGNGSCIIIEEEIFQRNEKNTTDLPRVDPSTIMYLIFTSGSTGTPKGVKISHRSYASSAVPRARAVGYNENSKVLDFASYAFDVSIDSMLLTLSNGGCLCIPSDEERLGDINGAIRRMEVNYAGLTPSVARILDIEVVKSLDALGLGGEAASARDITLWGKQTRIVIGYGPCECTIGCSVNSNAATGREYSTLGPGNGAVLWLVDPNDHESLVPLGAVGEILVEGPIVGQGYLNDPEKTAAAFINDPKWLVTGHGAHTGRHGLLYKTGDLGSYDPAGTGEIVFAGRKDTQVKLRGQRIELEEIESHLKTKLPQDVNAVAEVIKPKQFGGQPMLVVFLAFRTVKNQIQTDLERVVLPEELKQALSEAQTALKAALPRYMVPTTYIPLNYIPSLISGKIDRKKLRQFDTSAEQHSPSTDGNGLTHSQVRHLTDTEKSLQSAWATVLKISPEMINVESNFFSLGGDSLAAMKLVSVARDVHLNITVSQIFMNPSLEEMSAVAVISAEDTQIELLPFSMTPKPVAACRMEAAHACRVNWEAIEDIYPSTPTQESLFAFSLRSADSYIAQRVAKIPPHVSIDSWKGAWEVVVAESPILRTRLVQLSDPAPLQVIIQEEIEWSYNSNLDKYLKNDSENKMMFGQNLARYAIINRAGGDTVYMVWTVHHALYDGWSEPIMLENVYKALSGDNIKPTIPMIHYVHYLQGIDNFAAAQYWRNELSGAIGPQFPRLPSRDFSAKPDTLMNYEINFPQLDSLGKFTPATLIRAAWALVASQYTGSDDVVFGETLTGRDIALAKVEDVLGPLIATVPMRIVIDRRHTAQAYLEHVSSTTLSRANYQHIGMQNIRKASEDAQFACEAGTGLVIQLDQGYDGKYLGLATSDVLREALNFNPYPLMLAFGIRKGSLRVCTSFDSRLITRESMERIIRQFEEACLQLTQDLSRPVADIDCLPVSELNQVWQWNEQPPTGSLEDLEAFYSNADTSVVSGFPTGYVKWICNLQSSQRLSPIGCPGELWLEGIRGQNKSFDIPKWLLEKGLTVAARASAAVATGDIAMLREDGTIEYLGKKEDIFSVQGRTIDIANLEAQCKKHLPTSISIAGGLSQHGPTAGSVFLFFQEKDAQSSHISILPGEEAIQLRTSSVDVQTRSLVASHTVDALQRTHTYLRNNLPSHMLPKAYIPIDSIPRGSANSNRSLMNEIASHVPEALIKKVRSGFESAWRSSRLQARLSGPERILQFAWAKVLGIGRESIGIDDNFFRLGGDSVLAMKLVANLRIDGHSLRIGDIFQHMRLADAAGVLRVNITGEHKIQPPAPYSLLSLNRTVDNFLDESIYGELTDSSWKVQDVLPITTSQMVDIEDTVGLPRTSLQYVLLYPSFVFDKVRLEEACRAWVKAHDILRTVFVKQNTAYLQVILTNLDASIVWERVESPLNEAVKAICSEDIELPKPLGSSFLKLWVVEDDNQNQCLLIRLSHSQYDGVSLPILLRSLESLYSQSTPLRADLFSAYIGLTLNPATQQTSINYWRDILSGSSMSILDNVRTDSGTSSVFLTRQISFDCSIQDVTTATVLTTAWAIVLSKQLKTTDVTFGSVTSGRNINSADLENVVGPCYQFTPVRVHFKSQQSKKDLLSDVQKQGATSAAHDFLGFKSISERCTTWPASVKFFNSIVHHQDFENFDTLPFGDGSCRVEALNPHGDAAYPLKVVSYVRGGQQHFGIVGNEENTEFLQKLLVLLIDAVRELVISAKKAGTGSY